LEAIIRTIVDEGRTVLFSSHLLDEVERVAERLALLNRGRMVFAGELDELKESHRCLTLRFNEPLGSPPELAGVLAWQGQGRDWTAVYRGRVAELAPTISDRGGKIVDDRVPSLSEIFMAQVSVGRHAGVEG
jgi:ABC-2 type transport system ATP-binding protein